MNLSYPLAVKLSKTGKMPCASYSIPAQSCITGSKLNLVPGSVCFSCYARKNMYVMPSVRAPRDFNLSVWEQFSATSEGLQAWVEMMVFAIAKETKKVKFFRWFDSGDLQGLKMLRAIVSIAEKMPEVKFWLPTHEKKILEKYRGNMPLNLTIRQSAAMVGEHEAPVWVGFQSCSVGAEKIGGFQCKAYSQGGKCLDCRACWNQAIPNVNYPLH